MTGTLGVLRAGAELGLVNVPGLIARPQATSFYADEARLERGLSQPTPFEMVDVER